MDSPKLTKRHEEKFGIPENHGTVTVRTTARVGDTSPQRPKGPRGKMEIMFLKSESESGEETEAAEASVQSTEDDEEELQDVQESLKTSCGASDECTELRGVLDECNERVNSREKTLETCEQELLDFVECVDACVAKELFKHLT